ncbi:hypothetical protein C5S36_15490 [Candidatus Methanophagaceae archaeon]|nr:hypothetical protein C5S36_15490 [Methanophagales archaeon]
MTSVITMFYTGTYKVFRVYINFSAFVITGR